MTPAHRLPLIAGGVYAEGCARAGRQLECADAAAKRHRRRDVRRLLAQVRRCSGRTAPGVQFYANYSRSVEFPGFASCADAFAISEFAGSCRSTRSAHGRRGRLARARGIARWDLTLYRSDIKRRAAAIQCRARRSPHPPSTRTHAAPGSRGGARSEPRRTGRMRQVYTYSDFRFRGDAAYGDNRLPVVPRPPLSRRTAVRVRALHVAPDIEWVPHGPYADYRNLSRAGLRAHRRDRRCHDCRGRRCLRRCSQHHGQKGDRRHNSAATRWTPASVIFYPVEQTAILRRRRRGAGSERKRPPLRVERRPVWRHQSFASEREASAHTDQIERVVESTG